MHLAELSIYVCVATHTSGVWATDLAIPNWRIAINVGSLAASTAAAAASATSASTSASGAATSATTATTQASSATASASSATTSAATATTGATNASASATAAASSATNAATSAATINLPSSSGQGLNMLRQNAGTTGFEYRTPTQVRSDLSLGTAALVNTGTSGATIPLLNAGNTWGATQTFTKQTVGTPQAIITSGAVSIDLAQGNNVDLTLSGNMTSLTFTNPVAGQGGRVNIIYSGGAWTVAGLSANFKAAGGASALTFSSTSGQIDKLIYDIRDATHWDISLMKNPT